MKCISEVIEKSLLVALKLSAWLSKRAKEKILVSLSFRSCTMFMNVNIFL